MDQSDIDCQYCGKEFKSLNSLRIHTSKLHKKSSEQVYIDMFCDGKHPTCKCGCGQSTKFWTLQRGFADFVRGHQSRVKNNWGHNKEALERSQQARREMHDRGEIKIWNRGKTKETDDRIVAYGEKLKETFKVDVCERQKRSQRMTKNRLTKIVPDLKGKNHPQWKGGVSALQPIVRARLHLSWVYPILKRDQFTCQRCGSTKELCVHHSGVRFPRP